MDLQINEIQNESENVKIIKNNNVTVALTDVEMEEEIKRLNKITDKLWSDGIKSIGKTFSHTTKTMKKTDSIIRKKMFARNTLFYRIINRIPTIKINKNLKSEVFYSTRINNKKFLM